MTGKETIAGYIAQAAELLRAEFENIRKTNPHAGEGGKEVENIVKEFLNRHMPQRFRATAGFVIDEHSEMSGHEDVLIYDALSSPVFRYREENQIISADAVAAVVEVKSVLNKKELENSFAKIAEVKKLHKRRISEMDQKATESQLTTTGTLGVIFGFDSDLKLVTVAQHCAELNEQYDTYLRPDVIVVLDSGVINYTAHIVGSQKVIDFATTSDEDFPIPPFYVQLSAREDGHYALNRFFVHLLSHLAFYPRRPSIPPFSVMLEGAASVAVSTAVYQYNTEARLVPFVPAPQQPNESLREIKLSKGKEHLGTLRFIPWQDGGVIRKKGKVPLTVILVLVSKERPIIIPSDGFEYSMVLKATRRDFENWASVIESKSDMRAELAVPPLFEARPFMNEGTGEPFIARIFLAPLEMNQSIMPPATKQQFDEVWSGCVVPALEMRKAMLAIKDLVGGHKKALRKNSIVRKKGNQLVLTERIDGPLRNHVAQLLEMASHVIDNLPVAMKFLGIEMSFYAAKEQRFLRGWERAQKERPELADYLMRWRPKIMAIAEKFQEMRYSGWHLPNIVYRQEGDGFVMKELEIDNLPVVEYAENLFSDVAVGLEELIMYALQGQSKGSLMIDEIPLSSRNPQNPQRFKRNIRGMGVEWALKWSGKGFYES
jgi:hypothetical protein